MAILVIDEHLIIFMFRSTFRFFRSTFSIFRCLLYFVESFFVSFRSSFNAKIECT